MADKVFEDRVGLYVIRPDGLDRLPAIQSFAGGLIRDLFLPRTVTTADMKRVRDAGLFAHLWWATDGLGALEYANRALQDIANLKPGAGELNIELGEDLPLPSYILTVVDRIRVVRPNYRLRINVAPWKGFALPRDRLASDNNLYAAEQNYEGNMQNLLSPADVLNDMLSWGVPGAKATVCYAANCTVLGSSGRLRSLPDLSRLHRGVIFSDDLMADAGLL